MVGYLGLIRQSLMCLLWIRQIFSFESIVKICAHSITLDPKINNLLKNSYYAFAL